MTPPAPAGRRFALLLAVLAYGLLAMTICIPSMADWRHDFAPAAGVPLVLSGYILAYGGLQLVYGPLADRFGGRRVLLGGLALAVAASVAAALAPGLAALVAARVLQGAGAAAGMVVGRALVQDLFQGPERTRAMAWVGMAMGLCPPLATLVGGQVHAVFGWRANFALIAALGAGLWVVAWRGLPAAAAGTPAWRGGFVDAYRRLARQPGFIGHVAILALTTATFYAFLGGAPIVLAQYGVGPRQVGFYVMCIPLSYIVGNWLTTRLVRRHGERLTMALGQALTVGGLALLVALAVAGVDTPLALALPLLVLGVGHGLLVPPVLAATVGLVPALAASAAAAAGVAQQLTGAAGSALVGLLPHDGARQLGALMLAFALGALAVHWRLLRRPPA